MAVVGFLGRLAAFGISLEFSGGTVHHPPFNKPQGYSNNRARWFQPKMKNDFKRALSAFLSTIGGQASRRSADFQVFPRNLKAGKQASHMQLI